MEIIKLIVLAIGFGTAGILVYGAWRFSTGELRAARPRSSAATPATGLSARSA